MPFSDKAQSYSRTIDDAAVMATNRVARGEAAGIARMSSGARPTNEPDVPGTPIDGDYPQFQRWGDPVGAYPIAPESV